MVRMAYEYYCLLVCVGVYCYEYSPISWKNLLPPSLGLYFLQNFGEFLQNHTLSHPGLHKHKSISSNYFFPLFLLKVKGHPVICLSKHRVSLGAGRGWLFSTTPPPLCHRQRTGTHCTWPGRAQKMSLPVDLVARTVQAVSCLYTDCAISGASFFGTS